MITQYTVNDTWQAISTAGESGTCWIVEFDDLDDARGASDVVVYHTDGAAPVGDEKLSEGKRLLEPSDNDNMMVISADNTNDVFYARCKTPGSQIKVNVDVS